MDMGMTEAPNPLALPVHETRHKRGVTTYYEPKVEVKRTYRDDPIGQMYARGQLGDLRDPIGRSVARSLLAAGRLFQDVHQKSERSLRSSGDIREHVDGGRIASDGITEARVAAAKQIASWGALLGRDGYRLLYAVLIDKRTLRQVSDAGHVMPGKAATTFHGHWFRQCLTTLARSSGYGG